MTAQPAFTYCRHAYCRNGPHARRHHFRGVAMKDASEPSNIVSLTQRLDPSSERGGALLNTVRDVAGRRLQILINGMFEHVDDALFDLAEKAENNAAQMHYFDGMREVRKRRPIVERAFLTHVSRE